MRASTWFRFSAAVLAAAATAGGGSAGEPGGKKKHEWPMYGYDARRTGYSPDLRVKPPFRLKWVTQTRTKQKSTPCVAAGKVFVRGYCLDAEAGEVLWKYYGRSETPACDGKRLYVDGGSTAIDLATQKQVWRKRYRNAAGGGHTHSGAVLDKGTLFRMRMDDENIYMETVKAATGKVVRSTRVAPVPKKTPPPKSAEYLRCSLSAPLTVTDDLIFGSIAYPRAVFALDRKTGKEIWRQKGVSAERGVSSDGKTVWAAEDRQGVWALDAKTGKRIWHWGGSDKNHYNMFGTAENPPVVAYGLLLVWANRNFMAIHAKTGKEAWRAGDTMAGSGCGGPTAAGGHIYAVNVAGEGYNRPKGARSGGGHYLYAIDPKTGKPVWKHHVGNGKSCGQPAIAYGRLYVPTQGGEVFCFEPAGPDDKNEPQAPPKTPAAPLTPLVKPFGGKPGEAGAGGKPKGGADWPMYGGSPARCGLEVKIGLPIKEAWKFPTGGKVKSSPVIADGMAYVGSDSGKLFALDLATGKEEWSAKIGSWVRCAPAVAKGIVVVGADDGVLRAFDAATGKPKWQFKTAGQIRASPAIVGDRVVFGSWDGHCYCVRLSDGKEFWRFRTRATVRVNVAPAVASGRVYVGALDRFDIWALDLGTGKPLAGYQQPGQRVTGRFGLVHGMAVYRGLVATTGAGLIVDTLVDAVTGKRLGSATSSSRMRLVAGAPAFRGGQVFTYNNALGVRLSDVASGRKVAPTKRRGTGFNHSVLNTPVITRDLIVAATDAGTLEVRQLPGEKSDEPAKLVWEWKSPSGAEIWTAPAAAGGFIVVGSDDGHVYGFSYTK